ncbi:MULTISPECIES: xanthine dehydrogenase family protein molybdopterin-binding subunit [Pseudonocardia]|uniref:2-furoyl-CoA dehydrogenase large subunit n=1 Tax=Pseudonocardia oroxyli TaxID=366584 RepID=A0A1G7JTB1_PSEOR|nr:MULTISPECIES: xanthine dehydrogenase family protein molybdopterin-binding subunit [Pseudonocardia]MCF7549938.1 xanthine dehydrogenase family protein molybdopterin-binding subunit [Pseudonocardia sp. WMMC193]SDF28197.1 2-furoyl-CoA dehydrogenase large subunit [Pseudonocardia oroxyli]
MSDVVEATRTWVPSRDEDAALVTGRGAFLDDLDPLPGTLVATVVRSTRPHARLRSVDLSRARAHPGVAAVIGPEEVRAALRPFPLSTGAVMPYLPTGVDKVRFVGEPIAVVVASDRYVAEDAAELVAVEYEELGAVTAARAALEPDAPLLHEDAGSNVATDRTFSFGPVEERFRDAAHVVTGRYDFPRYSSVPMECYSVIAQWLEGDGGPSVECWANFHGPFSMVPVMAGALGIPTSRVRLHVPADIGGSFGIKAGIYPYVVLMALASKHAGTPVRWAEDRVEHLMASSTGADRAMTFSAAVDADGTVTALRTDLIDNVGAYLRPPEPSTLYRCYGNITGPYRIDAVEIRARAVVTNTMPTGLNRGFGGQQLYFGLERLMDAVAAATGLDVVEVRRRNLVSAFPHETATGGVYDSGDYAAALDLVVKNADLAELERRREAARAAGAFYGIGTALVVDPSGTNIGYVGLATPAEERKPGRDKSGSTEHVRMSVDLQGIVTVLLGSVPQGQGHATVARKVAAQRLGLPLEQVRVVVDMDTATTPWTVTSGSYSSRFAPLVTSAVVAAADTIAATVKAAGATLLEGADPGELTLLDGKVVHPDGRAVAFRHAAGVVHWDPASLPDGVPARLYAEAEFSPRETRAATADDRINSSLCYGFVAEIVAVRIDPDTLEITVDRVSSVHDAGTVLDQTLLDGQVYGALVHGLGGAAYEEFTHADSGQPTAATFLDYLCPTSAEAGFDLRTDHVVTPSPLTPLGAKGCGEGSSMSFPVAYANAVADALAPHGIEITRLPLHGEVLHRLLTEKENS